MTIEEMHEHYNKPKKFKLSFVKQFWDTHPTDKQEYLRHKITMWALFMGITLGIYIGIALSIVCFSYLGLLHGKS